MNFEPKKNENQPFDVYNCECFKLNCVVKLFYVVGETQKRILL